jgi:hypothetical protein
MEFVLKAKELEKGCPDTISTSVHIGSCAWGVGPLLLSPGDTSKMLEYHLGVSDMCGVSIELTKLHQVRSCVIRLVSPNCKCLCAGCSAFLASSN